MELSARLIYDELINVNKSLIMVDTRSVFGIYFSGFVRAPKGKVFWLPWKLRSGVVNENFGEIFRTKFDALRQARFAIICRSGRSSKDTVRLLRDYNFDAISVVDGFSGYDGWINSRLPFVNPSLS